VFFLFLPVLVLVRTGMARDLSEQPLRTPDAFCQASGGEDDADDDAYDVDDADDNGEYEDDSGDSSNDDDSYDMENDYDDEVEE